MMRDNEERKIFGHIVAFCIKHHNQSGKASIGEVIPFLSTWPLTPTLL